MKWVVFFLGCFAASSLSGQGLYEPLSSDLDQQIERWATRYPSIHFHPSLKNYGHLSLIPLAEEVATSDDHIVDSRVAVQYLGGLGYSLPKTSSSLSNKIYTDSTHTFYSHQEVTASQDLAPSQTPKRWFFSSPGYLFSRFSERYFIRINPHISWQLGASDHKSGLLFQNTRGLEVSGGLGSRFYFYTQIVETQARFPKYLDDYIDARNAIPGNGFYKKYNSQIVDLNDAYDYLNSSGHLSFRVIDEVSLTLGHGRHFIGNGIRSMLLSDFTNNYFYLQADWRFWRIHYRNIWAELKPRSARAGLYDEVVRRKYMATHVLSLSLRKNLHWSIFESVVFDRSDQFELGYLNPVILYRTVEQSLSSPDNVLLGFDLRWDLFHTLCLYGQVNFDEFVFNELFIERKGWWGNKYAWQLGATYFDAMNIEGLDIQGEWNGARPYTYTHRDSTASYAHTNLPLAHPLGANFKECLLKVYYRPRLRWEAQYTFMYLRQGLDKDNINYGSNILLSHTTRPGDYGHEILQGRLMKSQMHQLNVSFLLFTKCWVDFSTTHRLSVFPENNIEEFIFSGGLRWNFGRTNTLL